SDRASRDRFDQSGFVGNLPHSSTGAIENFLWACRKGASSCVLESYRSLAARRFNMPNTVRLHRVLRAPVERVYKAFLDADALVKWMAPNGFTARVHHIDAKIGGTYK